jgi:hypothetical protein
MRILPAIPEKVIKGCKECRYVAYDPFYSCGTDSGYDCCHKNNGREGQRRIVDDNGLDQASEPDFIPEWCPLEKAENNGG